MNAVVEFLQARVDEDEEYGRAAIADDVDVEWTNPGVAATTGALQPVQWELLRVMSECAAKRRIIALYHSVEDANLDGEMDEVLRHVLKIISHLAKVYADHDDYRPEWRA